MPICSSSVHWCWQASTSYSGVVSLCLCSWLMQDLRRTRSVMVTVNNLMDVW